jgi:MFS family permease
MTLADKRLTPHPIGVVAAVTIGTASVPLDTAVNVAFPYITAALSLPTEAIGWVIICYVLTYASLLLVAGRLADRFGHRRLLLAGLVVNFVGLTLCALSTNLTMLGAARAVQGIGAAAILAAGPALITLSRPDAQRLGALGTYTIAFGLAGAVGPMLGGWAVERLGWTGVFWFRLPIVILGLVLAARYARQESTKGAAVVDPVAFTAVIVALMAGLLAMGQLPRLGALSPVWLGLALAAIGAMTLYGWRVRHHPASALFDAALLRNRRFVALNFAHGAAAMAEFAVMLLVPFFLLQRAKLPPLEAGMVLACAPAGIMLASIAVKLWSGTRAFSRVAQGTARALPRAVPPTAIASVAIALAFIADWPNAHSIPIMASALGVAGFGYGLYHVTAMDRVMGTLSKAERGVAGSISMLVRTAGVVGAASLTTWWFATHGGRHPDTFDAAFASAFVLSAMLAGLAAIIALFATPARSA